jgi:hypothetical protein
MEAGACNQLPAPTFPVESLSPKGNERQIERYPGDTDEIYKERVAGAWVAWSQAGTVPGMLSQLTAAGFDAEIKECRDWDWDGDTANRSRFWVILHNTGWTPRLWGDGHVWGVGVWGVDAPIEEVNLLVRIVMKWKPGHMVPIIIVVLDEAAWAADQPDGTWGDAANRNPAALYHYFR